METPNTITFWQYDAEYWFQKLNSSEKGQSRITATKILAQTGGKRIAPSGFKKDVLRFLSQFKSPLMLLLIGAVILSGFLGDTADEYIILLSFLLPGYLVFFRKEMQARLLKNYNQ